MHEWQVFEIKGLHAVEAWAWCFTDGGAGFIEIRYTRPDGVTPTDPPKDGTLGRHLFSAPGDIRKLDNLPT